MEIVQEVLRKQQKDAQKYKTIQVEKHLDCNIDVGRLLLKDPNELDEDRLK